MVAGYRYIQKVIDLMEKNKAEECSGGGVTILNTVVRKYLF